MVPHNQMNKPLMRTAKYANLKNVMSGRDGKHGKDMLSFPFTSSSKTGKIKMFYRDGKQKTG